MTEILFSDQSAACNHHALDLDRDLDRAALPDRDECGRERGEVRHRDPHEGARAIVTTARTGVGCCFL